MILVEILRRGRRVNYFTVLDPKTFPFKSVRSWIEAGVRYDDEIRAHPENKTTIIHHKNLEEELRRLEVLRYRREYTGRFKKYLR